jgi:hypothetical protein
MRKRRWLLTVPLGFLSVSAAWATGIGGGTKVGNTSVPSVDAKITPADATHLNYSGLGALGTVRSQPSSGTPAKKQISCWLDASPDGTSATCQVVTGAAAKMTLRCTSQDPNIIAAVASISGDSMVTFWTPTQPTDPNSADDCVEVTVENGSQYLPKAP